ncbi:hypothetical protein [Bradyrhizobium stylosanthis]|uniref:Uncharacterized protein n=1 Tax=Bradyrhizobium stylosanthis TaxID=1803665 RepID=A0A560E4M1_9BRAD|nr:hypothetical protein [Bradyrhizobium stylosanthis]TWB04305.1 hypothetical protein FBZ96_102780 [Bradyrhizobium stylosanthis]
MLATLNSKQIVDEIVKDTVKDNDPHDAIQISPEIVLASRPISVAPALAPEITPRPEPKFAPEPKIDSEPKVTSEPKLSSEPRFSPEPKFSPHAEPPASVSSVATEVRVTADDGHGRKKRSSAGRWVRGAFVTFLFAGTSAAATIAWEKHGDTARQKLAEWTPVLASLLPSTSQTAPVAAAQAAPPAPQAAADQPVDQPAAQAVADQPASPPAVQVAAAAPVATQTDATQSVQSMTRDLAAMAQQIETLKANIAELKAGQEQMAREMVKPPAPKPVVEAKPPVDPRARVSALPPRTPVPAPPPVRKPKPVVSHTYMPAYSPAPVAPPPPPVTTTQAVADDDGPVVRPPMPLR